MITPSRDSEKPKTEPMGEPDTAPMGVEEIARLEQIARGEFAPGHGCWLNGEPALTVTKAEMLRLLAAATRGAGLVDAIRWALGEDVPGPEFEPRQDGEPTYWWRKELRRRYEAALSQPTPALSPDAGMDWKDRYGQRLPPVAAEPAPQAEGLRIALAELAKCEAGSGHSSTVTGLLRMHAREICAALSAPTADAGTRELEWLPISTAPLDKTTVALLHVGTGGFTRHGIGWYMPLDGWQGWQRDSERPYLPPTHWSPLPDTAALTRAGGEKGE